MRQLFIVPLLLLALWLPASGQITTQCIPPNVTYLGQGPGYFTPTLGGVGVLVSAEPPIFAPEADVYTTDHVWSVSLGNVDPMELRVLPPGYHLFVGEFPADTRVRLWVFGHMDGAVRFYDALTRRDLLIIQPGDTAFAEFTTISDGQVVVMPTEGAYVMLPACAEQALPGTIPPKDPPLEPEPRAIQWQLWLLPVTNEPSTPE